MARTQQHLRMQGDKDPLSSPSTLFRLFDACVVLLVGVSRITDALYWTPTAMRIIVVKVRQCRNTLEPPARGSLLAGESSEY